MTSPTFRLRLLGGVALESTAGVVTGRATQRRRLAALALMALAPGRMLSRDKLVALLWPEAGTDEARHRLAVTIYELRRVLGDDAIVTRGDDVWLDPARVSCDVADFEAAVKSDDVAAAVRLYAGPFMDGVHLDGAPEFEEWAAAVRDRLQRAWRSALEDVARMHALRGELVAAAARWHDLACAEPYSGRIAIELMRALDAAGDRAAALMHATAHAARLREDLGLDAAAEVERLAAQLRTSHGGPAPILEANNDASDVSVTHEALEPRGSVPRRRVLLGGALIAGLAVLAVLGPLAATRFRASDPVAQRIAVLPFTVSGDAGLEWLGAGMPELLGTALDGAGSLRTVDAGAVHAQLARSGPRVETSGREIASRFSARGFVTGSIFANGGRVRIHASIGDVAGGATAQLAVDGTVHDALRLVDELAAGIIAQHARGPSHRTVRIAALTTHSLPALRAWLSGESLFRAGNFVAAADSFHAATQRDSTFALAHYRLALAALWADREGVDIRASDERALRHADRLGQRDRLLLSAYAAWRAGDANAAESGYREVLHTWPDDVEAWFQLGETLFHYNPLRGRAIAEAAAPLTRVLELDPAHRGAIWHLALLAAHRDDQPAFQRLLETLTALTPDAQEAESRRELDALRVLARGGTPETADLAPLRTSALAWRAAVFLRRPDAASHLLETKTRGLNAYWAFVLPLERTDLQLARGRLLDAAITIASLTDRAHPSTLLERRVLPAVTPGFARPADTLQVIERELDHQLRRLLQGDSNAVRQAHLVVPYLRGLLRAARADTAAVRAEAVALAQYADTAANPSAARAFAATLRAHIARAAGRAEEALHELDAHPLHRWYGWTATSPLQASTHERFLRAELLVDLGRGREALGWFAGFGEHSLHDLAYLAPAQLRMAEIQEGLGHAAAAAHHYARVLELWNEPDAELIPLRDGVRERMRLLADGRTARGPTRRR